MSELAQDNQAAPTPMTVEGPVASNSLVRRTPVPRELEALGVKVAVDPESDMQILIIPKALREKANVLTPVQAFQQADPNWRPSLRVVELDPSADGPHFYKQQGNKLAPRKQALELLADAAGIVQMHTQLVGRERVVVGDVTAETFTHVASAKIRKSDGTLRSLQASRTYEPFAEYEEIRDSAAKSAIWENGKRTDKTLGDPGNESLLAAEVRKRWLNEVRFAKAKNESKAVNRAIRAAIQISQTFSVADAQKPFVVVGWNLAPQSTEAVQAAIAQLYGAAPAELESTVPSSHDWDLPEVAPEGEVVDEEDAPTAASAQQVSDTAEAPPAVSDAPGIEDSPSTARQDHRPAEASDAGDQGSLALGEPTAPPSSDSPAGAPDVPPRETAASSAVEAVVAGEQTTGAETAHPPAPVVASEPVIPGVEPTVEPAWDYTLTPEEEERLLQALAVKLPSGSYQGRTVGWVLEVGEGADEYLNYALRQEWPLDQHFKAALTLAVKAHRPEMYAAWRAEA